MMKRFILTIMLLVAFLIGEAAGTGAPAQTVAEQATVRMENRQTATATVTQEMGMVQVETDKQSLGDFLVVNWGILSLGLLSFLEVVTRLTPSQKDNTILAFLSNVLNAIIPNRKKGGGRL